MPFYMLSMSNSAFMTVKFMSNLVYKLLQECMTSIQINFLEIMPHFKIHQDLINVLLIQIYNTNSLQDTLPLKCQI